VGVGWGGAALCLASTGAAAGGWGLWVLAALWMGFWNAAVRPGILRLGFSGAYIYWALLLSMLVLNGVLFLGSSTWLPLATLPDRQGLLWSAVCVALFSWALSSRFRSIDGRWHWITYHGSIKAKAASSSNQPETK
jgi:uncharacterized membrane protein YvlD (DUF360 family)